MASSSCSERRSRGFGEDAVNIISMDNHRHAHRCGMNTTKASFSEQESERCGVPDLLE